MINYDEERNKKTTTVWSKLIIYNPGKHLFVKHAQKYVYGTHNKCMKDR